MSTTGLGQARSYLQRNTQLLAKLGICPQELVVQPLGKGEHNENFVFFAQPDQAQAGESHGHPTRFVLRVNRVPQPFHKNQVAYEFAALQALQPSGCVPAPLHVDCSADCPGTGVLVESFCEGSELDFDHLRPHDLQRCAQLMANIHAVPVPQGCPLHAPADPLRTLFQECVDRYKSYQGTMLRECGHVRWVEKFLAATQDAIDAAPDPAPSDRSHIINTETLPSHFLLPANANAAFDPAHPGVFLDWERPIIAEPAQDLAFFVAPSTTFWDSDYLFPRANIEAFTEQYWQAVDGRFDRGTFDRRFSAWLCASVLRSQAWFCKNAARYEQGAGAHTVERTFKKWGIYTSADFNAMLWKECF